MKRIVGGVTLVGMLLLISLFFWKKEIFYPVNKTPISASPTAGATYKPVSQPPLAGWKDYSDDKLGITFSYPENFTVEKNGDYSVTATPSNTNPVGPPRFFYISVVPAALKNDETSQVYNYNPIFHNQLLAIKENETKNLGENEGQKDWYSYERLPDEIINGQSTKVFLNKKPWEFPVGTYEYRYIIELGDNIIQAGGYVDGDTTNGLLPKQTFQKISESLKFRL